MSETSVNLNEDKKNKRISNIKYIIKKWVVSIIIIGVLDYIWLGIIQKDNWKDAIKSIQGSEMNIRNEIAIIAYLILACIPVYVNISYKHEWSMSKEKVIIHAGIIGFFVYAMFNFTNYAIFKSYPIKLGIYDTLWGVFLISFTTYVISHI